VEKSEAKKLLAGRRTYATYVFKSGKHKGMRMIDAYHKNRQFILWLALESHTLAIKNMARQLLIDLEQAECELETFRDPNLPEPVCCVGEEICWSQMNPASPIPLVRTGMITAMEVDPGGSSWLYTVLPKQDPAPCLVQTFELL
jgi:hypothetical protein